MYTLFIDTHSSLITVGLVNEKNAFVIEKESEMSHSENLMTMISDILKQNNVDKEQVNEIIVVNGPGSFTGLRIGLTVAKVWASMKKIRIKTIDTLKAYQVSSDLSGKKVCIIDAPKGYFVSLFNGENLLKEEYTTSLDDYKEYKVVDNKIDIKKIYNTKLEEVDPDLVKANYLKKIDVEK